MKNILIAFIGSSGCGKTTILRELQKLNIGYENEIVSDTSRSKRPGEAEGVDYNFESKFQGKYIEKVTFGGNTYGVSVDEFNKNTLEHELSTVIVNAHGFNQLSEYIETQELTDKVQLVGIRLDVPIETSIERLNERGNPERIELVKEENEINNQLYEECLNVYAFDNNRHISETISDIKFLIEYLKYKNEKEQ